jgi:ribosomal protein L20A (L18A)
MTQIIRSVKNSHIEILQIDVIVPEEVGVENLQDFNMTVFH